MASKTKEHPRGRCETDGCENLVRSQSATRWGKHCEKCHKKKYAPWRDRYYRSGKMTVAESRAMYEAVHEKPCMACGWDKAACDAHRVIPASQGGRYRRGNIVPLCPNCHRLVTHGVKTLDELMLGA